MFCWPLNWSSNNFFGDEVNTQKRQQGKKEF